MSRILRRPMFRGGPISSYGTGIASGLGYNTGGRVGYSNGGGIITLQDILKQGGAPMTGQQILDFAQKNKLNLGPNFNINPSSKFIPEQVTVGEGTEDERDISYSDFVSQFGVPKYEDEKSFVGGEDPQGTLEVMDKVQVKTDEKGKVVKDKLGNPIYTGNQGEVAKKLKTDPKTDPKLDNKEVSTELTVDDYVKMLGGDKAKRRDLGDMLGRASAAFLGTGDVREGIAKFMETESKAGPGRLEKIQQAAAMLDIKDKIAGKRASENIMQTIALAKAKLSLSKKSLGENIMANTIQGNRPTITNIETGVRTTFEGTPVEKIPTREGAIFEKGDESKIFIDETTRNVFTVGPDLKSITILY